MEYEQANSRSNGYSRIRTCLPTHTNLHTLIHAACTHPDQQTTHIEVSGHVCVLTPTPHILTQVQAQTNKLHSMKITSLVRSTGASKAP